MRTIGIVLLIAGLAGLALAFLFPVAITPSADAIHDALMDRLRGLDVPLPGSVANLDLIAQRSMLHASAGYVAIVGAVLTAAGSLSERAA
jgi:hypothetical protein